MRSITVGLLATIVTGFAIGALAEGPEIVVTATRSPREAVRVPASVTVIDAGELEISAAWNLDDALRSLEGVFVLRSVGLGTGLPSQINMRGVAGQHAVLLLLDGLPLNDASSGFMNINQVPIAAARQIEVVRGPFSSLYGADAFAGVVNILTLDPEDTPTLSLGVRAGSDGFLETTAQAGMGSQELGFTVTYSDRSTDNYLGRDHVTLHRWNSAAGGFFDSRMDAENYDYEDQRLLLKVLSALGETADLEVYARYFNSELGYGQTVLPSLYPLPVDSTITHETLLFGARLSTEVTDSSTARFTAYYREQVQESFGLNLSHLSGVTPVYVPSQQETEAAEWEVDAVLTFALADGHQLSAGADVLINGADFGAQASQATGAALPLSADADETIQNTGLYVQDEFAFAERFELISGLRVDNHSEFGDAISPKAGLLVEAGENTVLRTSVGRAYRAPTLLELYQPASFFGNVTFVSNADLDPEYILSADAGVQHQFAANLSGHVDVFYNDMDDVITKRISGSTLTYDNTSRAWSAGVEAGLAWEPLPGIVALFVNYTGQETEDRDLDQDLEHMPEHAGNAGLRISKTWRQWVATVSVTENYVGARGYIDFSSGQWQDLDEYWRTDLAFRTTFNEIAWVGVSVENATDEAYQEWPLVARAPSRLYAVEAGIRYW